MIARMNPRELAFSLCLAVSVLTLCAAPAAQAAEDKFHADPAKMLGAEACTECHAPMAEAWKLTHHFSTFNTMHRSAEGKDIASKMGLSRIKDESLCLKCHYTVKLNDDGNPAAVSGISCESCHGAAKDWNTIHSATNNPNHLVEAAKLGLLRPIDYYHVAANCFSCHTVPEEKLVNTGGHKAGSDFELVSWLSGEVRHDLFKSAGKVNAAIPIERQRMLYIIGRALDLEYSLRGLAKATADGSYAAAMLARVNAAKGHLEEISKASSHPEVAKMLAAINAADLKPGQMAAIDKMADEISKISIGLSQSEDGSKLASVDSLLPKPDAYKGTVYTPAP